MKPTRLQTLPDIDTALWDELSRTPLDRDHPWRIAVLATTDGEAADARSVVLRECERDARVLRFFTDARSAKVQQMQHRPQGTLVLWSAQRAWQLRLRVALQVDSDGLAVASRWARLQHGASARDYLGPLAPGTALDARPLPRAAAERGHFALVTASVLWMDWLELHAQGHRRAIFDAAGGRWVAP
jgi:pyridoxamine 5'-phosphate oxidase